MDSSAEITRLLAAAADDREQLDRVFGLVYAELKTIAHRTLARNSRGTLCTTALVHEAYARLAEHGVLDLNGRKHFYALCARAMRHIVIDHARRRQSEKRGGGRALLELQEGDAVDYAQPDALVALDAALNALEQHDPRLAELLQYRLFAGLELPEIAEFYGLTLRQMQRDWQRARIWLYRALLPDDDGG
ncbi:ECF-type sigma factor [Luteimonas suaedae]|uniref:ECF-type sigma factor n=1 Tax=Luteimonas suaedae TaxID=2605430 RepID=UPI0011EF3387|nr:ECF-type sigma factor [Luteimonas suaedae]